MKTNFFNLLRKLAGKPPEPQQPQHVPKSPEAKSAVPSAPKRNVVSAYVSGPQAASHSPVNGNGHSPKGVEISLQKILSGLSLELQPKVVRRDAVVGTISVPLEKVLSQLSRGQVRITFGELRQLAPSVFACETDKDTAWVSLPLEEILSRLNPALITRRRVQRQVEVPEEISSPFEQPDEVASSVEKEIPREASRLACTTPAQPYPVNRHSVPGIPPLQAPEAFPPIQAEPAPLPNVFQRPNGHTNGNGTSMFPRPTAPNKIPMPSTPPPAPVAQKPRFPAMPPTTPPPVPERIISPIDPAPIAPVAPIAAAQEPPRIPMPAAKPAVAPLVVPLAVLAGSWPEPIRNEILHSGLTEAQVNLPFEAVEQGLRQGRILLPWKMIRMWVRPAPQVRISPEDATVLELPLAAVAPLFLTRRGEMNAARTKVSVDQDIPNLFFGFPQPEPENKSPTQDTNFYVWDDSVDQVKPDGSPGNSSPGTRFVAKYATPNEVVSRAAALEGVAGALIALPDGLMVANRLPSDLNGDTLSAFLPQIFSKVSQCTRELRMGELNNLNFTVGNVPWKIFRVNAIFFAAFGRAGAPLPTAQLAALAAELDHKPK